MPPFQGWFYIHAVSQGLRALFYVGPSGLGITFRDQKLARIDRAAGCISDIS